MPDAVEQSWIDKSAWGPGPWKNEPDRVEWRVGPFVALMLRQPTSGHWCGYVGVPPGHPWHGLTFGGEVPNGIDERVRCHGGVTYAAGCMEDDRPQAERVCHVPAPGEPDDVWWVGFDCAHAFDLRPSGQAWEDNAALGEPGRRSEYRDAAYVRAEVAALAVQAVAAAGEAER